MNDKVVHEWKYGGHTWRIVEKNGKNKIQCRKNKLKGGVFIDLPNESTMNEMARLAERNKKLDAVVELSKQLDDFPKPDISPYHRYWQVLGQWKQALRELDNG